jgi:hypothetical protein
MSRQLMSVANQLKLKYLECHKHGLQTGIIPTTAPYIRDLKTSHFAVHTECEYYVRF